MKNTITLLPHYSGFREFVKHHNITPEQVDKCFSKGYFERNPMYRNDRCINIMLKFLGIEAKVKTVYPTHSTVRFDLIK